MSSSKQKNQTTTTKRRNIFGDGLQSIIHNQVKHSGQVVATGIGKVGTGVTDIASKTTKHATKTAEKTFAGMENAAKVTGKAIVSPLNMLSSVGSNNNNNNNNNKGIATTTTTGTKSSEEVGESNKVHLTKDEVNDDTIIISLTDKKNQTTDQQDNEQANSCDLGNNIVGTNNVKDVSSKIMTTTTNEQSSTLDEDNVLMTDTQTKQRESSSNDRANACSKSDLIKVGSTTNIDVIEVVYSKATTINEQTTNTTPDNNNDIPLLTDCTQVEQVEVEDQTNNNATNSSSSSNLGSKVGSKIVKVASKTSEQATKITHDAYTGIEGAAKATGNALISPLGMIGAPIIKSKNSKSTTKTSVLASHESSDESNLAVGTETDENLPLIDDQTKQNSTNTTITGSLGKVGNTIVETATKTSEKAVKTTRDAFIGMEDAAKATGKTLMNPLNMLNVGSKNKQGTTTTTTTTTKDSLANLESSEEWNLPPVPTDETLKFMNTILKKRISGLSVKQFYNIIWDQANFYIQWLETSGKQEINVEDWTIAEGGYDSPMAFQSEWKDDDTKYGRKRTVDFNFIRTTHLYTGPPVAQVKQTHWGRVTDELCIIQIQVNMDGIPFANCFNVQIRWVVTRINKTQLQIEVGLYVNFVEQTILAGKIRSGTTEETTKTQQTLLNAVLEECSKHTVGDVGMIVEDEVEEEKITEVEPPYKCFTIFPNWLGGIFKKQHVSNTAIGQKTLSIQKKVQSLINRLDNQSIIDTQIEAKVDSELTDIQEALLTIDKYLKMDQLGQFQASRQL